MDETNESIPHQPNESHNIALDIKSESSFTVEMDESNDSVDMVEMGSDSTDADDDGTTLAELIQGKSKAVDAFLNRMNSYDNRTMKTETTNDDRGNVAARGKKLSSKQLASRNQKKCNICGYTGRNFNRHVQTRHNGEKPFRCEICARRFGLKHHLKYHLNTVHSKINSKILSSQFNSKTIRRKP